MICRLDKFYLQKDRHLFSWVLMQHYVENSIAFFILPDPEKMQQLLQNLSPEYLNTLQRNMNQRVVNLYFPKFTVSATYDLETVMRTLGITQIFSNNADLSKVTKDAPVKVSKAVHKAVLAIEDTDRKNAQFSNVFKITSPKVPTVKFNRPFLVIIKDKALDLPFIVGKIGDPKPQ
nr:putative alpha-1-antitrypsin-related protein [Peromyscus maniculatus bairdii]